MAEILEGEAIEQQGKNLENKISSLETQIISQFKISYSRLPELVRFSSEKGRDALKVELRSELTKNAGETLVDTLIDYDVLASKIEELGKLKNELKKQVREGIEGLNKELQKQIDATGDFTNPKKLLVSRFFSEETLNRCNDPRYISDQLIGLGIGSLESLAVAGKFVGEAGLGVLKLFYDVYLIIVGKAKYEGANKV